MLKYTSPALIRVGKFSELTRGGCNYTYDRRGYSWRYCSPFTSPFCNI